MKYFLAIFSGTITGLILWLNINLYSVRQIKVNDKADILLQLNFLESELKQADLGNRMQEIFPEGYVFSNALYGLAWCEVMLSDSLDNAIHNRAIKEAVFAYDNINSDNATCCFDKDLSPEYGIFYCGWRNYLLGKILSVDTSFKHADKYIEEFKAHCSLINAAMEKSGTPYLQSYDLQAWPVDMFVAVASLSIHDKIFKTKYKRSIQNWLNNVQANLDLSTGMIPHSVNPISGKTQEGARGSSMSLMLKILVEIDTAFAKKQYRVFSRNFVSTIMGLPSVREFPVKVKGEGDIDSGPVIFGVGFSATIDMIGVGSLYGDIQMDERLYRTINAFGFETGNDKEKKYLFGKLPIADAFIVWGRSLGLKNEKVASSPNWRLQFHFISLGILAFICGIFIVYRRIK